ncbi:MAG TPA: hypothetical protein VF756_27860 [Thermoanaerobaculia bacterium]
MGVLVLMLLLGAGAAQALPEVATASPAAERWAANPLTELWSWMASWLESVVAGEEETGGADSQETGGGRPGTDGVYIDPNGGGGGGS